jgi:histidyl-tRNA synthetase
LALDIYTILKIKNLKLIINSVGDPVSRDIYKNKLKTYVKPLLPNYCADCHQRFTTNPLRILDCKNESCKRLNEKAPNLIEHLNEDSLNYFDLVQKCLAKNNIPFEVNPYLVRGLDYYTHTVFEIIGQELGSQDAICGGGRYDLLAEQLSGPPTPAVGFAAGIERLLMVMEAQSLLKQEEERLDIFISPLGEKASFQAVEWVERLRKLGYHTDRDYLNRSIKAQMREANRLQARLVFLLGDHEINKKEFTVKEMDESIQKSVSFKEVETYLEQFFGNVKSPG